MYPKLMASHRYLYLHRDPAKTGLVYIRHPWESGLDNSPSWDRPLKNIQVDKGGLPAYERKDLTHGVPAEQRPSDEDYDRYVYLVDLFRENHYDETEIYRQCIAKRDLLEQGLYPMIAIVHFANDFQIKINFCRCCYFHQCLPIYSG